MLRSSIVERAIVLAGAAIICACASAAQLPVSAGFRSQPTLPPPEKSAIPLVKVVTARGWPDGQQPVAAEGTTVTAFAQGLQHPRWLYVLPNGDVLVAETNDPERPEDNKGISIWCRTRSPRSTTARSMAGRSAITVSLSIRV